jgi:hypothetical protein
MPTTAFRVGMSNMDFRGLQLPCILGVDDSDSKRLQSYQAGIRKDCEDHQDSGGHSYIG